MSESGRESETGATAGGPPPGWPSATTPEGPAPHAFGPGMTLHGEPLVPAFPEPEAINPFGVTNAAGIPPLASAMAPPAGAEPAPMTERGPVLLGPEVGRIGPTATVIPLATATAGPIGTAGAPGPLVAAGAKPLAKKSRVPVLVGILAIAVAVTGAIAFVVYRQRAAEDAEPEATLDVPKKKKKAAPTASAAAAPATPPPAAEPDPTEEPAADPSAEPTAEPTATASATAAPKPAPTSTTPKPTPTSTTPKPAPTSTTTPAPTSTTTPAPTSTTTSSPTLKVPPSLRRPVLVPGPTPSSPSTSRPTIKKRPNLKKL